MDKADWRGYAFPTTGAAPTAPDNQWTPSVQKCQRRPGAVRLQRGQGDQALLTSHGWTKVGGVMTCQDPAKCGNGIPRASS